MNSRDHRGLTVQNLSGWRPDQLGGKAVDQQFPKPLLWFWDFNWTKFSNKNLSPVRPHSRLQSACVGTRSLMCPWEDQVFWTLFLSRFTQPRSELSEYRLSRQKSSGNETRSRKKLVEGRISKDLPLSPINVILYLYNRVSPTDSGTNLFL